MINETLKSLWKTVSKGREPDPSFLELSPDPDDTGGDRSDFESEPEIEFSSNSYRSLENSKLEKIFKYCVIVALIVHFSLIAAIPLLQSLVTPSSFLKPGEKVTQVRLVEPQEQEKPVEPPPKEASAISDRDHTALKERLPKIPPAPKAPLGQMDAHDQRMASLMPPAAPENPIKPKKESPEKETPEEEARKKPSVERNPNINKKPEKEPSQQQARPDSVKKKNIDLRPTQQELAKGMSRTMPGSTDFFPDGDVEEAVVDINTREDKFYSYMLHLKKKIEGVWVYPSTAAKSGLGGSLAVEFSIAKDGQLLYVNLLDSSGHTILDESALRAIRSAAPYFPFPPRLQAKRLKIRANFIYITSNYLRNIM